MPTTARLNNQDQVLRYLRDNEPADLFNMKAALGLNQQQIASAISRLRRDGHRIGKAGNSYHYTPGRSTTAVRRDVEAAKAKEAPATQESVTKPITKPGFVLSDGRILVELNGQLYVCTPVNI